MPGPRGVPGHGGVPGPGVCAWSGVPGGDPPRMATAAGGTHPNGMYSSWDIYPYRHLDPSAYPEM